jgi:hypothetical protein
MSNSHHQTEQPTKVEGSHTPDPAVAQAPSSKNRVVKIVIVSAVAVVALGAGYMTPKFLLSKPGHRSIASHDSHPKAPHEVREEKFGSQVKATTTHPKNEHEMDSGERESAHEEVETIQAKLQGEVPVASEATQGAHADVPSASKEPRTFFQFIQTQVLSIRSKILELEKSERENERLRLENAQLRVQLELQRHLAQSEYAREVTEKVSARLKQESGSKGGRTLSGIQYQYPSQLLPDQAYALAVSYFKAREDERTAVILNVLTGLEDDQTFKTPSNYLMAGVSWYRLQNYRAAEISFLKVLESKERPENLRYHAQARLWLALTARQEGFEMTAQKRLVDLVDHHPRSLEASLINQPSSKASVRSEASEGEHP